MSRAVEVDLRTGSPFTATPPATAPGETPSALLSLRAEQDGVASLVAALGAEVAQIKEKLADLSAADRAALKWQGAVQDELDSHARLIGAFRVESSKDLRVGEMKLCADELKRKREQTSVELLRDVVRDQSAALVRMCAANGACDGLALQYQGDLLSKLTVQLLEVEADESSRKRALTLAAACAGPAPAAGGAVPAAASEGACVCGRPNCHD